MSGQQVGPRIWAGPECTPAVAHYYWAGGAWCYTPGAHLVTGESFVPGCEGRPTEPPAGNLTECHAVDWYIAPEPPAEPSELDRALARVAELEVESASTRELVLALQRDKSELQAKLERANDKGAAFRQALDAEGVRVDELKSELDRATKPRPMSEARKDGSEVLVKFDRYGWHNVRWVQNNPEVEASLKEVFPERVSGEGFWQACLGPFKSVRVGGEPLEWLPTSSGGEGESNES